MGSSHQIFTCSNSTIETLEKGVEYVQDIRIIKTPERRDWRFSVVLIVNFEHIWHLFQMFLLFTLNR